MSLSPDTSGQFLTVDDAGRPRANSDPTVGAGCNLPSLSLLPEITVEDCGTEPELCDFYQDQGGLFGHEATPRRRANTCPEDLFRKERNGRPPTPPPAALRKPVGRVVGGRHKFGLSKPVLKESVSFTHHKLSKLAESEDAEEPGSPPVSGRIAKSASTGAVNSNNITSSGNSNNNTTTNCNGAKNAAAESNGTNNVAAKSNATSINTTTNKSSRNNTYTSCSAADNTNDKIAVTTINNPANKKTSSLNDTQDDHDRMSARMQGLILGCCCEGACCCNRQDQEEMSFDDRRHRSQNTGHNQRAQSTEQQRSQERKTTELQESKGRRHTELHCSRNDGRSTTELHSNKNDGRSTELHSSAGNRATELHSKTQSCQECRDTELNANRSQAPALGKSTSASSSNPSSTSSTSSSSSSSSSSSVKCRYPQTKPHGLDGKQLQAC